MAASTDCNNSLSPLVTALHSLPRITQFSAAFGFNSSVDNFTITSANPDTYIRAWFWGALIAILTVAVLFMVCVFYCCACCFCCCGERSKRKSSKGSKIGCALFTVTLISLTIILLCVSLWLETAVDNVITTYLNLANSSNTSDALTGTFIINLEFYRFRVALGILSFVILMLLLSLISFACTPCCKSPAAIIIFMVIYVFITLLMSIYASVTFFGTVYASDVCTDVYNLVASPPCEIFGLQLLETFCNGLIVDGFLIVILSCATIIVLFSLQVFGTVYANLITRSKYTYVETVGQSSEIFISSPLTVGGTRFGSVWNAYGAQTVLGVKSRGQAIPSGYSPEAYPMGAVAPVAPIAALPSDDQQGIKEVTLHMKDIDDNTDASANHIQIADV